MIAIPEGEAVVEALRIGVGELKQPVLAGVGGFVDAGLLAGSGSEQVRFIGAEGFDVAEVEFFCAGDLGGNPGLAGVSGAEIRALGATSPYNAGGDGAHAAQVFGGVAVERSDRLGDSEGGI